MFTETRYARNGDLRVAYRASAEGERDIVFVPNWFTNCEVFPELRLHYTTIGDPAGVPVGQEVVPAVTVESFVPSVKPNFLAAARASISEVVPVLLLTVAAARAALSAAFCIERCI